MRCEKANRIDGEVNVTMKPVESAVHSAVENSPNSNNQRRRRVPMCVERVEEQIVTKVKEAILQVVTPLQK